MERGINTAICRHHSTAKVANKHFTKNSKNRDDNCKTRDKQEFHKLNI